MKQIAVGALLSYVCMSQRTFNNVVVGNGNRVDGNGNLLQGNSDIISGNDNSHIGDQSILIGNNFNTRGDNIRLQDGDNNRDSGFNLDITNTGSN